jgi:hypothetical protein
MKWQMTVAKAYGRVMWRLVIGGKGRQKGLFMSEEGQVLTTRTDSSYGIGRNLGISGTSGSVEDDVLE